MLDFDLNDLYILRKRAQDENLANRDERIDAQPTCQCGNLLTIVDRGGKCTDCRRKGF